LGTLNGATLCPVISSEAVVKTHIIREIRNLEQTQEDQEGWKAKTDEGQR